MFTTVSVSQVVQRHMVSWWVKDKLERIFKHPDVANWSSISQIVRWTEETNANPSKGSRYTMIWKETLVTY